MTPFACLAFGLLFPSSTCFGSCACEMPDLVVAACIEEVVDSWRSDMMSSRSMLPWRMRAAPVFGFEFYILQRF